MFSLVSFPTPLTWKRLEVENPGFSPSEHDHGLQFSQVAAPSQLTKERLEVGTLASLLMCTQP
jgi:hypothetical protein